MHVAVISPINTPDGISRYSKSLYSTFPREIQLSYLANRDISNLVERDDTNVHRCWIGKNKDFSYLSAWVVEHKPDIVHIQLHPEYLPPDCLAALLEHLKSTRVIVTMHSFGGWYKQYGKLLSKSQVKSVIIHNDDPKVLDSVHNNKVTIIPHGFDDIRLLNKEELRKSLGIETRRPIIVTHGLITSSKGLLETAAAIKLLMPSYPEILWLAANAANINPASQMTLVSLQKFIQANNMVDNVILETKFLTDIQATSIIQVADIGVFAYADVGEGASGAVRRFISCGIPTIVTNISVMNEFKEEVLKVSDNQPGSVAAGIKQLWENKELQKKISQAALAKTKDLSWDKVALRLLELYNHQFINPSPISLGIA